MASNDVDDDNIAPPSPPPPIILALIWSLKFESPFHVLSTIMTWDDFDDDSETPTSLTPS